MGGPGDPNAEPPVLPEHLLIRFIDCDVRPGYSYEYQIQVKMFNPVWGKEYETFLADRTKATNPELKVLKGPWVSLGGSLTVPEEAFLFAGDTSAYNKKINDLYGTKEFKKMRDRFEAKEGQTVVQVLTWMEQVRTEAGGPREPVGAWVVADMPVGRGEYVGRKTFVQLPLWSSSLQPAPGYTLREVPQTVFKGEKSEKQPQGWLIDFTADKSVLVDFTGGPKVNTSVKVGPRTSVTDEDVATELLIVREDGGLVVRNSAIDATDDIRTKYTGVWDKWLAEVQKAKSAQPTEPKKGEFDPKGKQP